MFGGGELAFDPARRRRVSARKRTEELTFDEGAIWLFPVPDSPVRRTVTSSGAKSAAWRSTAISAALRPTRPSSRRHSRNRRMSRSASDVEVRWSSWSASDAR